MTAKATSVEFKFDIESGVSIVPNGRSGTVIALCQDRDKTKWIQVQYADNVGVVHQQYFRESELS
jgi:hypothetical protein